MRIIYHHRTRSTDAQRIHIREIVDALAARGHEVAIVSLIPIDAGECDATRDAGEASWKTYIRKIPFAYELAQLGYNLVGVPLLLWSSLRRRTDIIYERYALLNFAGLIVARMRRIPLLLEVNSPFALEQARDGDIRAVRLARWSERYILNRADRVITVSTPLARILERAGVSGSRIEVMFNGVCLDKFRPGAASPKLLSEFGLTGHLVIGFVGWFRNWHGLDLLLRAFHEGNLAACKAKLLLIGDGPVMPELRSYVREHALGDSVIFTGPVPHTEVPQYLDLIDIAVQPSANEYCCPMKILEYMALGKAIVAPRQENIEELLLENGQLFKPGNAEGLSQALLTLLRNPETTRERGLRSRRAVTEHQYLWSTNARRIEELSSAASKMRRLLKREVARAPRSNSLPNGGS